jgi:hypothetical protein
VFWLLTPKGPKSLNGFFGSLGRFSRHQKHECVSEIFEECGPMYYLQGEKINFQFGFVKKQLCCPDCFFNLWAIWAAPKKHQKSNFKILIP